MRAPARRLQRRQEERYGRPPETTSNSNSSRTPLTDHKLVLLSLEASGQAWEVDAHMRTHTSAAVAEANQEGSRCRAEARGRRESGRRSQQLSSTLLREPSQREAVGGAGSLP